MAFQNYTPRPFNMMPPVIKNLLIINVLVFIALVMVEKVFHEDLNAILGLYYPGSAAFRPFQIITSMFSHGSLMHIAFNMFALWMFGTQLERVWGSRRFLTYFVITGIGASLLHTGVNWYEAQKLWSQIPLESHTEVMNYLNTRGERFIDPGLHTVIRKLDMIFNIPVVGASGAIYGLLLAFGMLFPNVELMLIFLPIPIKAKYFIPLLILGELYLGVHSFSWDNIAHFAHLGGMLFGYLIIRYWSRGTNRFF